MKWFAFAFMLAVAACALDNGYVSETHDVITIKNNGGGNLAAFQVERARLAQSDKIVRIEGYCASACTIFYSLDNACLASGATLHFHGAAGIIDAVGDAQLAAYYRAGIKREFMKSWRKLAKPMHELSRDAARALDPKVRFCEGT